jgi:acyl-CoA thioesterase
VTQPEDDLPEAYYLPGPDGGFTATVATESPWDKSAQHGGPPSALFAHVIRSRFPDPGFRVARLTVEFLRSVPRSDIEVSTEVVRDGRRIRLIEAAMTADGKRVALARAWQIATNASALDGADPAATRTEVPPPIPAAQPQRYFTKMGRWGYGESVEWRWVRGSYDTPGEARLWTRLRIPLVAGHETHPLDRFLVVADSANGVSGRLDMHEWLFIPPAVTFTVHRYPVGEWVYMAAATDLAPDGLGTTSGTLSDESGTLGTVVQPLLVAPANRDRTS